MKYMLSAMVDANAVVKNGEAGYQIHSKLFQDQWFPTNEFCKFARKTTELTFGQALEAMRFGFRVKRASWGGSRVLVKQDEAILLTNLREGDDDDRFSWLAEATDLLAEDWMIVE